MSTETSVGLSNKLIVIELEVEGLPRALRALVDTGASNNFVRSNVVKPLLHHVDSPAIDSKLIVKLANGSTLPVPKLSILLSFKFDGQTGKDSFLLLDLDDRFDAAERPRDEHRRARGLADVRRVVERVDHRPEPAG